jgi:lysozyme family protein
MSPRWTFTEDMSREYEALFATSRIRPERAEIVRAVVARIFQTRAMARYREVAEHTGVPAPVIGILHSLEANLDFGRHLHNGDPLSGRTVRVPRGRPVDGTPPFTWAQSAADVMRLQKIDQWTDWTVSGAAYVLERYNGFGYRNRQPPAASPYLWSFTTAYASGKYVADHVWSDTAVSNQCGGMALLREMFDSGRIEGLEAAKPAAGQCVPLAAAHETTLAPQDVGIPFASRCYDLPDPGNSGQ